MSFITKSMYLTMITLGGSVKRHFEKNTINSYEKSMSTLKCIIRRSSKSDFGKKHDFISIKNLKEYKEKVPISTYDDYEKYIMKMCRGEKNILVCDNIKYFALTSGTTGKQKLIPTTRKGIKVGAKYMGILTERILYENLKEQWNYGKGIMLTDIVNTRYTISGIPISSATSGGMKSIKSIIPFIWTSPIEVMSMNDKESALYLHILFALRDENLSYISGIFISSILDFFRTMEKQWKNLVYDISHGTLNENLKIEPEFRKVLLEKNYPLKKRASEIEGEFKRGFKGIAKRLWKSIVYIATVTGGSFSVYDDKVNYYSGNLIIYSNAYAASEAVIGMNPNVGKISYVVLSDTAFYEFIPIECSENNIITKTINELEIGKVYEIVVTNFSGLYRYRIGDVVKVIGYYNNSPEIKFLYRKNQLLNMVSEKTTEAHVTEALRRTSQKLKLDIVDYSTMEDNNVTPGRYVFYMEIRDSKESNIIAETLDKELCKTNFAYGRFRKNKKLGEIKVILLRENTFSKIKSYMIEKGVSKNQLKIPRIIRDKEILKMLNENSK
ncbi:GH3 auxin-responsive promoter family protein [Clostridium senegalense]|uniref:GH3 auxin-responsive promoter family protein n=1 Tax=Clostridium senegalense TaxID=1465809 RepID=UPI001C0FFA02|nr:GH3 auxin-responsive promoter family protein [Clostridium senegalense]